MKWFSLVYQGDVHPARDEKVIPKDAYSKLLTAEEIVDKAKEDAQALLENTRKECEALKEQAKSEGFQEGLEKLNEQVLFLNDQLKAIRLNMQQLILPIALKAAKKIVSKELEIFPETIVDIVSEVLTPIAESLQVTIYVNKEDKEILDANKPKIKEILQQVETLVVQEKGDIEKGGCVIKTEGGMINATVENQWRALERAFVKYQQAQQAKTPQQSP